MDFFLEKIDIEDLKSRFDIFVQYEKIYNICKNQIQKESPNLNRQIMPIMKDCFIMALKMNRRLVEHKIEQSSHLDFSSKDTNKSLNNKYQDYLLLKKLQKKINKALALLLEKK